jgi:hypothetical protein
MTVGDRAECGCAPDLAREIASASVDILLNLEAFLAGNN